MTNEKVLEVRGLCKSFGNVKVLKNVDLVLNKGEVLGLVGENGAGKSTLMNILGGVHPRSSGEILLWGQQYLPKNPFDAVHNGIAFIHQELSLFTNLSIAENIFIDEGLDGKKILQFKEMNKRASGILKELNLTVEPSTIVEKLTIGMRQMVEIAKAISKKAKVIIFDEPTTSLSNSEKDTLFQLIKEFSFRGISMIYISHVLNDVIMLCDEIVVLRDGEKIGDQVRTCHINTSEVISRMVGRSMDQLFPYITKKLGHELLAVHNVYQKGSLIDISFSLQAGEIVGIFGLIGAGRTELARAIYGIDPIDSGEVCYNGVCVRHPNACDWVSKQVAFITENRRDEGILLPKSVNDNIALVNLKSYRGRFGKFNSRKQFFDSEDVIRNLQIKTASAANQSVGKLSGGNQQKVVIGKWLLIKPSVFILDEPTRGIDVGAKYEIYTRINHLAEQGTAVMFISSEMEELMGICDRIIVMCRGKITGELPRSEFSQDKLLKLAIGEMYNV
jgi:ribose transport system ATP-binding protein